MAAGREDAEATLLYRITEQSLDTTTPVGSMQRPWSAVRTATVSRSMLMLRLRPGGLIGLPRTAMTEGQIAQLTAFLSARGLLTT